MFFDKVYVINLLKDILAIDSPTGFTLNAMLKLRQYAEDLGYRFEFTNKGNGIINISGTDNSKTLGICVHVDTLGLMVRQIKSNGTLAFVKVGGITLPTLDGEYCKIYTRSGRTYTGTILSNSCSAHVYSDAGTLERNEDTMHIRIDEVVKTKKDVLKLGIDVGDFACIEAKTVITESGYIKSRFLDDKLSVAIVYGVLKFLKDMSKLPKYNVKILLSAYEEVGHGMAFVPSDISELIAVDMGCIGEGLNCTEHNVSICAKDASTPYDYSLTSKLIEIAKQNDIQYAVDIYPYYSSDVSAALRGGSDVKGALIGAGVHASHGMERSHYDAVLNTMKLLAMYLMP